MRGADKLLERVDGEPLLRTLAKRAIATCHPVIVTLPSDRPARRDALIGLDVRTVPVPDADTGMAASFRALSGVRTDLLICLGDMPDIGTAHMAALISARDGVHPVRATGSDGTPGQPVLFPKAMVPLFADLGGDRGGRALLKEGSVIDVPLPGRAALTDLDTPEAWTAWRARDPKRQ